MELCDPPRQEGDAAFIFITVVPGDKLLRIRTWVTQSYQDMGYTLAATVTGRTTAVVRPDTRSISRMYMCR